MPTAKKSKQANRVIRSFEELGNILGVKSPPIKHLQYQSTQQKSKEVRRGTK